MGPGPQSLRVAGLVQHRIDLGFAQSIQAVRRMNGADHEQRATLLRFVSAEGIT
jgi:hypothetical protein